MLSYKTDVLCEIEPDIKPEPVVLKPDIGLKPTSFSVIRRKRSQFTPSSGFVSKTLAGHFMLPREKSYLSNQNILLPVEDYAMTTTHSCRTASGTTTNGSTSNGRITGWTAQDRQKTMVQPFTHPSVTSLSGMTGAGGSGVSHRAAMVALQRSRTLTSLSNSTIHNQHGKQFSTSPVSMFVVVQY